MERFHIAEWYGKPFHRLDDTQRLRLSGHQVGGAAMSKADINRLVTLEEKASSKNLEPREVERLVILRERLARQEAEEMPCPFRGNATYATCTKPGGVCSIRLYQSDNDDVVPVPGERGRLRALCPWRFHQHGTAFKQVGERLLDDPDPIQVGEIGFLESSGNLDSEPGADVGRIDMILVKSNGAQESTLEWVAVEVQAVYFSGKNMGIEFEHLRKTQGRLSMAREKRRPDYRSSGVKRLMPQLQTKVPTLRRWGKKMAIIVDSPFYYSMGRMAQESDISNADIIWFLVDFIECEDGEHYELQIVEEHYTTLESATLGLTGGTPVSRSAFEERIRAKVRI
jgi:hypothetical protein